MSALTMSASIQVVLLAGTRGSRMPTLSSTTSPKCLLPISNRPMLFYSLFSIARSFDYALVITSPQHGPAVRHYCQEVFPADPQVVALARPPLSLDVVERDPEAGTAELLAEVILHARDVLVISADYVGDVDLNAVVHRHKQRDVAATVAFVERDKPVKEPAAKGKKTGKKKGKSPASAFDIEGYVLLNENDATLLAVLSNADLDGGMLHAPAPVVQRYPNILVRSDLADPHIYVLNFELVQQLLFKYSRISSIKFDLVPYLARRQGTLSDEVKDWEMGLRDVHVVADIIQDAYARRTNTVDAFKRANLEIAAGALDHFLNPEKEDVVVEKPATKKKDKKAAKVGVFETEGERVNVSADSVVGAGVSAGDRVSVKKSVIGKNCHIAANVKVNGCIILDDVTLEEGVNLAACVVCAGARIGSGTVLKNCSVESGFQVQEGTEGADRDFLKVQDNEEDTSIAQAFEFI